MLKENVGLADGKHAVLIFSLAIAVMALALRIMPLSNTWLWSDEIFSASLAEAGFVKALLGTVRHDLHPPVYYLQLVPWTSVFPGDRGLLLNSVMWDMARLAMTMFALWRISGPGAALIGGLAGAFLGSSLYNAENLRMWALSYWSRMGRRHGRPASGQREMGQAVFPDRAGGPAYFQA